MAETGSVPTRNFLVAWGISVILGLAGTAVALEEIAMQGPIQEHPSQTDWSDPFELRSVQIQEDTLLYHVGYGGGCGTHRFEARWRVDFTGDGDAQGEVFLLHDNGADGCEAYFFGELAADLSPLRDAYVKGGRGAHGTITLSVHGYQPPAASVQAPHPFRRIVADSWNPRDNKSHDILYTF